MLIKRADDKAKDIELLQSLLNRHDASADVRKRVEQEIRNIKSGVRGEDEAAYEINFHYGSSKNWAVIHDLRIEHNGRVAQIDHLLINRFLDVWVCESKRFSEGIAINEQGECAIFWNGRPLGIGSPHEQNAKHIAVIKAACADGTVELPKRLGFSIKPSFNGLVIVSKNARISRPKTKGWWNDGIVKVDSVKARIEKSFEADNNLLLAAKIIGSATLEDFATRLAALHVPVTFDWHGRYGLPRLAPAAAETPVQAETVPLERKTKGAMKSKLVCAACFTPVQYHVATFCWSHKKRFDGEVYCLNCQKSVPHRPGQAEAQSSG